MGNRKNPSPAPVSPALAFLLLLAVAAHAQQLTLQVSTDRADATYKAGETATFTIKASQPPELTCIFSKDGVQPHPAREVMLEGGKLSLTGTLGEPGFLHLRVSSAKAVAQAAAAFDPLQIKPSMPVPEDFDAFWRTQKAALAKLALHPTLTPDQTAVEGIEAFDPASVS